MNECVGFLLTSSMMVTLPEPPFSPDISLLSGVPQHLRPPTTFCSFHSHLLTLLCDISELNESAFNVEDLKDLLLYCAGEGDRRRNPR